jgi:hypothetical protein
MNSLNSHSRKDQIAINLPTEEFAMEYFKILNKKLEDSYIFNRKTEGNKLTFRGSIFRFVWNGWDVFNPISAGEIEFSEEDGKTFIRHKIYFTESLLIALIFHIIPLFTFIYESKLSIIVFIAIWIIYTINYSITVFRFNSYISEMLIKVNMESGYKFKINRIAIG